MKFINEGLKPSEVNCFWYTLDSEFVIILIITAKIVIILKFVTYTKLKGNLYYLRIL